MDPCKTTLQLIVNSFLTVHTYVKIKLYLNIGFLSITNYVEETIYIKNKLSDLYTSASICCIFISKITQ